MTELSKIFDLLEVFFIAHTDRIKIQVKGISVRLHRMLSKPLSICSHNMSLMYNPNLIFYNAKTLTFVGNRFFFYVNISV